MRTLEWTQTSDQEEDQDEEEEDDDEDDAEKKQNVLSKWQAKREIRPRQISVHFVALAFMGIILVSTNLQASAKIRGSEWSFDNQALQSVSSQFLCSQSGTNQTGDASQQKQDNLPQTRQQVNVITFVGNQISSIEPNAFRCVAAELRVLVFTANEINLIQADAFEGLHSVQVLLLDSNRLDSIPSEASLAALKSLRHLNLADNQIERLDGSSFGPHLSGLISLNLAGNSLIQVHPGALRHLVKLKTLTLSRCSNQSLDETPLDGLQELRFLHLDRARPSARLRVTENLCRHSPKLSSLLLKSNAIERVPQFEHCQNLLLLDLSYNNIRGSLSENFTKLPNLIDLYLGNNQLEFIAERALLGLRQLQVLELQNNRIKQIEPRAFLPVQPSLEELNLSHNPKLNQLSPLGLDSLKSLKCYGNHQLREMPHFKSALKLALTYAYHCCDYPQSSRQHQHPLEEDAEKSLIVRLAHKDSSWSAASRSSNEEDDNELTSELILWPQPTNQAAAEKGRHRRDNDDDDDGTWMDDDTELVSRELNRIRRQHSIFFVDEPPLETFPWHPASRSHANNNNSTTSERRPRDLRRKLDESASQEVRCAPSPGPFLPCRDLFDSWWLRVGIWSVFLLAFLGNTLVIVVLSSVRQTSSSSALTSIMWLAHSKRHIDVPRFLVINLAIADLLMAIYLGLLAFVDMSTLGNFKLHAIRWQYSSGCKLAGFLAVLSSELSVFILAIITLERNYAITNAVHLNRRLSLQKAMFIMFLGYTFALAMAIMPLYGVSDYRRYSVCLPLDIESSLGSQIYVITLIGINTFSFVLLLGCYLRMYFAIRGSQAWNANDLRIAKRMSILVLTDFLCWMPIVASGLASLFGYHLVGTEGMKTLTIFILPLNSVANPFLYAITTKKFKRDLSTLRRRARALVRLECVKQQAGSGGPVSCRPARHEPPHHHRHHQLQLQLGKHHSATCLNANNNQHRNHYRHDLLLVSHQHGGGGAKHQTAASKMRQMSEKNAAHRALNNLQLRSATNQQTCITCSCQQRARFHNLDEPIEPQLQQQLGPRIVLETATQTSRQPNLLETTTPPPPQLLRKSRSTNSGLTMMAMRREEQRQIAFSPTNLMISSKAAENYPSRLLLNVVDGCFVRGDKSSAASEEVGAPSGGPLTKMEESNLAEDSFGSLSHRQRQSRTILDADERDPSPLEPPPSSSSASGHQRDRTRLDELVRPAASRSYLSVDPFQAPAATAGGADLRSASACGHLVSCRAADDDDHNLDKCQLANSGLAAGRMAPGAGAGAGVGGSYDTVRAIGSGGGVGGGPMKLSRSIQRLLFGPLAKAWSSIQISLNSSAATHVGQQQLQPPYQHCLDQAAGSRCGSNLGAAATACIGGDSDRVRPNEGDCLDDILMMSSPLKRSMHVGERRMSRSCDTIPKISSNNNNNITTADLLQLNSPSHSSGQEQSSCDYDDDRRVLLATINRLATGGHRTRLVSGVNAAAPLVVEACDAGRQVGFGAVSNSLTMRGRCTRCRSWSPALLTKLENCIYQMKSKLSSGFVSQTANATRLASSRGFDGEQPCQVSYTTCPDKSHCSQTSAGETTDYLQPRSATRQEQELEALDNRLGDNQNDDDDDDDDGCEGDELELNLNSQEGDDDSLDDQFGEPPELAQLRRLKINSMWPRRSTRLRQQSSVNSDTISTRTAGTLMTNMSISSDSTASIQLALASSSQPMRLDIISHTNDDTHDITE